MLHTGDRIFVDEAKRMRTVLHDGDVVLIRREDGVVIKRILAMPGETIRGADRKVFRNGKELAEPYLAPAGEEAVPALDMFAARTVAPGELFVMGDNRGHSLDSRMDTYGPVHLTDVVGQYGWTYWHAPVAAKP